jgi:hypothetical protein
MGSMPPRTLPVKNLNCHQKCGPQHLPWTFFKRISRQQTRRMPGGYGQCWVFYNLLHFPDSYAAKQHISCTEWMSGKRVAPPPP